MANFSKQQIKKNLGDLKKKVIEDFILYVYEGLEKIKWSTLNKSKPKITNGITIETILFECYKIRWIQRKLHHFGIFKCTSLTPHEKFIKENSFAQEKNNKII